MASKKTRKRATRRDRRKAKASDFRRVGKTNARKVAHTAYDARSVEEPDFEYIDRKKLKGGLEPLREKPRKGGNPYVSFVQSLQRYG